MEYRGVKDTVFETRFSHLNRRRPSLCTAYFCGSQSSQSPRLLQIHPQSTASNIFGSGDKESIVLHQVYELRYALSSFSGIDFWKELSIGLNYILGSDLCAFTFSKDFLLQSSPARSSEEFPIGFASFPENGQHDIQRFMLLKSDFLENSPFQHADEEKTFLLPRDLEETFSSHAHYIPEKILDSCISVPIFLLGSVIGHCTVYWALKSSKPFIAQRTSWTHRELILSLCVETCTRNLAENFSLSWLFNTSRSNSHQKRSAPVCDGPALTVEKKKPDPTIHLPNINSAYFAILSHEIKTPLQGIVGLIDLIHTRFIVNNHSDKNMLTAINQLEAASHKLVNTIKKVDFIFEDDTGPYSERIEQQFPKLLDYSEKTEDNLSLKRKLPSIQTVEDEMFDEVVCSSKKISKLSTKTNKRLCNLISLMSNAIEKQIKYTNLLAPIKLNINLESEFYISPRVCDTSGCTILKFAFNKEQDIVLKVLKSIPENIVIHAEVLEETISELLSNSLKHATRGDIVIEARNLPANDETGQIWQTLQITFADRGCGMSDSALKNLFDYANHESVLTTRETQGVGLGLAFSYKKLKSVGGDLSCCYSREAIGTKFLCMLPVFAPMIVAQEEASNEGNSISAIPDTRLLGQRTPLRIMIVEDNPILSSTFKSMLQKMGYKENDLVVCSNGAEAVDEIKSSIKRNVHYNVIFMDIWMPIKDGIMASKEIKELYSCESGGLDRTCPVMIAITADHNQNFEKNSAFTDYFFKPLRPRDLAYCIETYFEKTDTKC